MYFVYAISSISRNYIYVGISDNVERRFMQHNSGFEKSTKPYRPFQLIIKEEFEDRPTARQREIFLKSSKGKRFLRTLLP